MSQAPQPELTPEELAEIERKYDPETAFRKTGPILGMIVATALVAMSVYHFYEAGIQPIRELLHRGVHLGFVLGLTFIVFGFRKNTPAGTSRLHVQGVPILDIVFAILAVGAALYLPLLPPEVVSLRVGNPSQSDIFMGTALLVITLEATRRAVGPALPIIAILFILFALYGRSMPGPLIHPGTSWLGLINQLYMTNQGIYGIAIGVMAKYVFLFILFGVLATRIGLGHLFMDAAQVIAGRYAGGPAKVAIFSSAFMGTISGSSIANTVTTGALTIPSMKKVGYPAHFAGAVEATSSTGGQITPPIMGAAAFIMVEYLEISLSTVLAAAMIPALLHYFGVFIMVHLEAKRLGLRGLTAEEMPKIGPVLRKHALSLVPLALLVYMILDGWTPDYAAVYGIVACVVVGFLNPTHRLTLPDLWAALALGAKSTLAVGAAAATVGIVVGVVTLTGIGFSLGNTVILLGRDMGAFISALWPFSYFGIDQWALFFSLLLIAVACILMGAGIPTTATYIILVAVAAPILQQQGVEPLVAHFFVFYYGVLADITPPVALAAYAAAGIAGSNPFKTGNTAFRLGIAKALVPFVFVYSPALLIVAEGFTWAAFAVTFSGAVFGIAFLGVAFSGYMIAPLKNWERWWVAVASFVIITPGLTTLLVGLVLLAPIVGMQLRRQRARQAQ